MGPGSLGFLGLFAPPVTVGGLSILLNGDDPLLLPISWLLVAVLLWVVAVRNWRMSVALTESGVRHQGWFLRQEAPWIRVALIELLGMSRHEPAAR